MLASLFRPKATRKPSEESGVSPHARAKYARPDDRYRGEVDDDDDEEDDEIDEDEGEDEDEEEEDEDEDEDADPLLPIFSSEVLGNATSPSTGTNY